jgi:hypothetical protein
MNFALMHWIEGVLLIWWIGLLVAFLDKLKKEKTYEK